MKFYNEINSLQLILLRKRGRKLGQFHLLLMVTAVGLGAILISCKRIPESKKVLALNDMKSVMWDMMKADEWYTQTTIKDTAHLRNKENIQLYEQVFKLHHTNREQFYTSYHYYQGHPDQLKVLIDSISAFAEREKAAMTNSPTSVQPK